MHNRLWYRGNSEVGSGNSSGENDNTNRKNGNSREKSDNTLSRKMTTATGNIKMYGNSRFDQARMACFPIDTKF